MRNLLFILLLLFPVIAFTVVLIKIDVNLKTKIAMFLIGITIMLLVFMLLFHFTIVNIPITNIFVNYSNQKIRLFAISNVLFSFIVFIFTLLLQKKCKSPIKLSLWFTLFFIISILNFMLLANHSYAQSSKLSITEICRKFEKIDNTTGKFKEKSYIVLRNNTDLDIYFSHLFLSTDEDDLFSNTIYNVNVPGGGYSLIELDCNAIDFSSNNNTFVFLSSDNYNLPLDQLKVPILETNTSYKYDIANNEWYINKLENYVYLNSEIKSPSFSLCGGFYEEPFNLYINVPENCDVYYTLDCSDPNKGSIKYDGSPIYVYDRSNEKNIYRSITNVVENYYDNFIEPDIVDKCFIVKAISYDNNGNASNIMTETYFIDKSEYASSNVISLTADPKNLFDEEYGIYITGKEYDEWYKTNYQLIKDKMKNGQVSNIWNIWGVDGIENIPIKNFEYSGDNYERITNFEYYQSGNQILNQIAGIKIQGTTNRFTQLKNFSLYAREKYTGNKYFDNNIFETKTHSISIKKTFEDSFANYLFKDRYVSTQYTLPIVLFVNGELWYKGYIYDKYNKNNISEKYGVFVNNIVVNTNGIVTKDNDINETNAFDEIHDFVVNYDMSINENYKKLDSLIDIQSYIDFQCANIYLGNIDYHEKLNVAQWHTAIKENNMYGDGRWRWALYDNDMCLNNINTFKYKWSGIDAYEVRNQDFYKNLKENKEFCRQFVNTFMDLENTIFSYDNLVDAMQHYGYSMSYKDNFFIERPDYINKCLAEEFNLQNDIVNIVLTINDTEAGIININTIKPNLKKPYKGIYFADYPIFLCANTNPGYIFDYWLVNGTYYSDISSIDLNIKDKGDVINIVAIFKKEN